MTVENFSTQTSKRKNTFSLIRVSIWKLKPSQQNKIEAQIPITMSLLEGQTLFLVRIPTYVNPNCRPVKI